MEHNQIGKKQNTRIIQGCPLSPYLFLVVMTIIFEDIHHKIDGQMAIQRVPGTSFDEVVYLKNRIDYTFDFENEIEYVLIKNGVNPFRLISNKHFNKHIDNVFKKYRSN